MRGAILSIAMAGVLAGALAVSAGDAVWSSDFDQVKKQAAERKVPILADFSGSDWCGWCIKLDKEVLSKEEFQIFAKDSVVLFIADFPRSKKLSAEVVKQNERLAGQYGIRGFPTILLLDEEGNVLGRTGYRPGGAAAYVEHLKSLMSPQDKPAKQE